MDPQTTTALLTGGFTIAGGIAVAILSALLGRSSEMRKVKVEDARRWLLDRRTVYAKYLALAEVMLREIDGVAVFLSDDGKKAISGEDDEIISEGLMEYYAKWEDSLQPLLGEVQLLATGSVADLADRVSGALMEITWRVDKRAPFISYYPAWFQAQDLLHVLRDRRPASDSVAVGNACRRRHPPAGQGHRTIHLSNLACACEARPPNDSIILIPRPWKGAGAYRATFTPLAPKAGP